MNENNKNTHEHIAHFNPDVEVYNTPHQDFFMKVKNFNAGNAYKNFNDFLKNDTYDFAKEGNGVTYIVWNIFYNDNGKEIDRDIVAFYTLSSTAIPYEDRIRLDPEEAHELGQEFDSKICGIPALKIEMFALDEKYQDLFYEFEGEDLPISAWVMRSIIDKADFMSENILGYKAIFLHALPNAENFYLANGFAYLEPNMQPLHCIDSDYTPMFLTLRQFYMCYDD